MRRMSIAVAATVTALLALVLTGGLVGTTASRSAPVTVETAPVTSATLVCPDIDRAAAATSTNAIATDVSGALTPPSQSTGIVTATELSGARSKTTRLVLAPAAIVPSRAKLDETVALAATGSVAASLVADQVGLTTSGRSRALSGVQCAAPATDWWFAGADGRVGFTDTLALANPAPTAAELSISLWGTTGPLAPVRLEALRLPARSAMQLRIAAIAPDVATVAIHVHATSGAVTAALFHRLNSGLFSDGADFLPATSPPARAAVVAGFVAGQGERRLYLADPGGLDATVSLRLVTGSGTFTPAGDNQVVVRAGRTRVISLDRAFSTSTGAVELTSDQPVVVAGESVTTAVPHRPDLIGLAATSALRGSAGIANGRGPFNGRCVLLLSAPKGAAVVRVSTPSGVSRTLTVPAGRSVSVDITATVRPAAGQPGSLAWPFVVTPVGSAPVYGVRVLTFSGAHGALTTAEPLIALPAPIVLPAVRPDPRVATR